MPANPPASAIPAERVRELVERLRKLPLDMGYSQGSWFGDGIITGFNMAADELAALLPPAAP